MDGFHYQTANENYTALKVFAKTNKECMTKGESFLWDHIRNKQLGVKFRRQHIIGDYIADFVCLENWLIIEIDGEYHNSHKQRALDEERTRRLNDKGFTILRFTNEQVFEETVEVIKTIKNHLII